jgi:predicted nucleic acid-binding protein
VKIIVDTNIVFSAILNSGSRIGKILLNSKKHFQFYTCDYLQAEIQQNQSKLLKLTKLKDYELAELERLVISNITFINEKLLPQELLLKTEIFLKSIDPNDTPFVALTTYLKGKLWTGDMQLYKGLRSKQFKDILLTGELSSLLDDLEHE